MARTMLIVAILIFTLSGFTVQKSSIATVEITISNIRNNKGQIAIGVFKDQASFEKEQSFINKKFEKKGVHHGVMTIKFDIGPGVYGFTLLDDENNDSKMAYNFFGLPLEGFGFSNYYHTGFTRPKFDAFKVEVKRDELNKSTIKIRYM
jgi:uncharacterized protein (DUF2141 family)